MGQEQNLETYPEVCCQNENISRCVVKSKSNQFKGYLFNVSQTPDYEGALGEPQKLFLCQNWDFVPTSLPQNPRKYHNIYMRVFSEGFWDFSPNW